MGINRRTLILGSAVAGVAAGAPKGSADSGLVVVIGAGLAGLAAARHLHSRSRKVVLLEARAQTGGRVRTSKVWTGMPVDLGASWIHGVRGNPLTSLADDAAAQRVSTSYDRSLMITAGEGRGDDDYWYARSEALVRRARDRAEQLDTDISLMAAIEALPEWQVIDRREQRFILHCLRGTIELEYGGSLSDLSTWYFDASKAFGGADELFPNGFGQLIEHLGRGLQVRLNERVVSLCPAGEGVEVRTDSGGRLRADRVVLTVPLGVLQAHDIHFGEPLSPERQRAISTIGMGLLNKCWLRFDRPAWPDDVDWLEYVAPNHENSEPGWSQWLSLTRAAGLPLLLAFNGADSGRALEYRSDAEMKGLAHDALRDMFGRDFPEPSAMQITRWSSEDTARGAYSCNTVGTTPQMRDDLFGSEWGGRLIFAGEATSSDHFGTAHGAYMTGERAARLLTGS